jgi:hypothetical protein
MKNSEVHIGLPNEAIRYLIAHDLRETWKMETENQQEIAPHDKDCIYDYVIQDSKNAIKFHQQRIKIAELRKGLNMVLENRGWEEFDVSDETGIEKDKGEKFYLSFIGTKAEYKELLKKLYPKK